MSPLAPPHRRAEKRDARVLAELVNIAGEGLAYYVWTKLAEPGESPWDVGVERAQREDGSFSYRNAIVTEHDEQIVAALIGYPLADEPVRRDYTAMPPLFVPLQQLEHLAPDTWYVNVLATYREHRGKRHGTALMQVAEQLAADTGKRGLSLVVSDANVGARRFYARCGYREIATRPMVKEAWENPGSHWLLLVKDLLPGGAAEARPTLLE